MFPKKRIILLLDESASMNCQRTQVIKGINEMIKLQKELNTEPINFSIIKFNSRVTKVRSDMLSRIESFNFDDYRPSGSTALYDAIGSTIDRFYNDVGTIMIIVTDGQENSSREYTRRDMVNMIKRQRTTKNWNFIYLSEDPTTFRQGDGLGIQNSFYGCSNTCVGHQQLGRAIGSSSLQNFISDVSKGKTTKNYNDWTNWTNFQNIPNRRSSLW